MKKHKNFNWIGIAINLYQINFSEKFDVIMIK